ncbi:MAG TPA: outer membrane protein assembly factor BamD [Geobacteraceae bacterium]|nr:outer membrane protein assembly factor BamD [Geobacteraceae bacterium]
MPLRIIICCCLIAGLVGCTTVPPAQTAQTAQTSRPVNSYLRQGDDEFQKKNYEEAIAQWKRVKESGTVSPDISAMADLRIADAQFESQKYLEASASYESFRKFHPNNMKAPYAMFRLALCYYNQMTGIDTDQTPVNNAVAMFENFLKQYPQSDYTADARVKLAECVDRQAQHEIYIGRYYYRTGKYGSSVKRLEECIARYPQAVSLDSAFVYLEKAYLKNGEKDKAREAYNRLLFRFPTSKLLKEAAENLDKKSGLLPW